MATYGQAEHSVGAQVSGPVSGIHIQVFLWTDKILSHADDEKSCMLLVMRVLSIVPLNFKVIFLYLADRSKLDTILNLVTTLVGTVIT